MANGIAGKVMVSKLHKQRNNDKFHQNRFIGHKLSSKKVIAHFSHVNFSISMHSTGQFLVNDCKSHLHVQTVP